MLKLENGAAGQQQVAGEVQLREVKACVKSEALHSVFLTTSDIRGIVQQKFPGFKLKDLPRTVMNLVFLCAGDGKRAAFCPCTGVLMQELIAILCCSPGAAHGSTHAPRKSALSCAATWKQRVVQHMPTPSQR